MASSPENRTKFMRPPSANQRPRTYAKPTASHRAIGRCRAVSTCSVAARAEGVDVGEHSPGREGQREPEAADNVQPALPHEVDGEQREDEQAGVPGVERRQFLIRAEAEDRTAPAP